MYCENAEILEIKDGDEILDSNVSKTNKMDEADFLGTGHGSILGFI